MKNMYNYMYEFEWDEGKNLLNVLKHGISFHEAQAAFEDKNQVTYEDSKHSTREQRYFCIDRSETGHIITVRFTIRNNKIRIIGAGRWRLGRKLYEKKN
jgi:uncharacterized protein